MTQKSLSHVDSAGKIRMVDITDKESTLRMARASCVVRTRVDVSALSSSGDLLEPLGIAQLVGIQAAKQTSNLIPLCHALNLNDIRVEVVARDQRVEISATVAAFYRTGVEMEALTACAFAALSVVNSLLELDLETRIDELVVLEKSGGRSGDWGRQVQAGELPAK